MQTNQFDSLTELNKFYNREKDRLERIERMCVHDWSSPVDDPYTISEGYGYKSVVQGSDASEPCTTDLYPYPSLIVYGSSTGDDQSCTHIRSIRSSLSFSLL